MAAYSQSVAYTRTFKMIDSADHFSKKTGLTCTVNISKAGGAFGAAAGSVSEVANGWYKVALTTADTGTLGDLSFYITATGADDTDFVDQVIDPVRGLGSPTALPNANAGASNGLPILGANATAISFTAGLTISNAGGDALVLTSSGSNGNAINASGNGTGAALLATAGATGNGIKAVGGATSGSAIKASGTAGNAIALELAGQGSAAALSATGGATGAGATFVGGGTSGAGITVSTTSGDGLSITPTAGNGIVATANGTSKHGAVITGGTAGTSDGVKCVAGTGGVDLRAAITGNVTGNVSGSIGSVTAGVTVTTNNDKTGYSLSQSFPSNFSSLGISAGGHISNVDTLTTYTGDTPQTGDCYARLGAPAGGSIAADIAEIEGETDALIAGVTVTTNNDKSGYVLSATGSAALTESYAADGAAFTLNQALYQIWSFMAEKNNSATTLTTKKLDGSTTAMTFTYDSATTPSTLTRAT